MMNLSPRNFPLSLPRLLSAALVAAALSGFLSSPVVSAQGLGPYDRDSAQAMLDAVRDDIKKNYYDAGLRGMDLDARFKQAQDKLKQATTRDQLMITVAQLMLELNDSHTFFLPPTRAARIEYGWQMQMVGDTCYVTAVKAKTDAEAKGLKPGDAVLSIDGYRPTRDNMWKMLYRYYALMPTRAVRLAVQSPGQAQAREVEVESKVEQGAAVAPIHDLFIRYLRSEGDIYHDRFVEVGKEMLVWKMPTFAVTKERVDDIMSRARNFKTLVIDLRGNGGGYIMTLERLVSHFFDRDVKIADLKGRKGMKPVLAKTRGGDIFKGQLVVLVDSESASASEIG